MLTSQAAIESEHMSPTNGQFADLTVGKLLTARGY